MSHHNIEDFKPLSVSPNFGVLARPNNGAQLALLHAPTLGSVGDGGEDGCGGGGSSGTWPGAVIAAVESCALAWHNHQPQLGPGWKRLAHERLTAPARRRTPPRSAPAPRELFDSYSIATRTPAPRSPAHHSCFSPACKMRKGRLRFKEPLQPTAARPGERTARAGLYLMKDAV